MTELIILILFLVVGYLRYRTPFIYSKWIFILFEMVSIFILGFRDKPYTYLGFLAFLGLFYFILKTYIEAQTDNLYRALLLLPIAGIIFLKSQHLIIVIGFSYLAFRLCYLAAEAKNKIVKVITIQDFLDFVFFLPIFSMGPIMRYSVFHSPRKTMPSVLDGGFRIIWGVLKFKVICLIFKPLTFESLFFDGYRHGFLDFLLAGFSYLLFLYFNFSGFMDIVIGAGAFIGVTMPENFNNPFASRNIKELWNRWHITLNQFMRDLFFLPTLKLFIKKTSIPQDGSIALSLILTFILTGLWHGFNVSYLLYGAFHGLGLTAHHFYSKALVKTIGGQNLQAYLSNQWIKIFATVITITYLSVSMFFFENSFSRMNDIIDIVGSNL